MSRHSIPRIDKNTTSNHILDAEKTPESVINYEENTFNRSQFTTRNRPGLRNRIRPPKRYGTVETSFSTEPMEEVPLETASPNQPTHTTIDIPEVFENVPLLTTSATAVDGTAASTIGTSVGVAAGGALVGAAGYGLKKIVDRTKKKGFVLPNSDYIGPGNPVKIDAPKNKAEVIAKEHDVEYGRISKTKYKTRKHHLAEVSKADTTAIKGFKKASGINAKIGEYGLKVKSHVEKTVGKALYPAYKGN